MSKATLELIIYTILIAIVLLVAYAISIMSCNAKTADIGYPSRYKAFAGCQIQVEERWIPLEQWYFRPEG